MELNISGYVVLIDDEDWERVSRYKWRVQEDIKRGQLYVVRSYHENKKTHLLGLHRFIMGCIEGDGRHVDHINHNTLDNRKCNLRVCSNKQNSFNRKETHNKSTGYKGVWLRSDSGKYRAMVRTDGKRYNCGNYDNLEDAIEAYDKMALYLFGDFACTNLERNNYSDAEIEAMSKYVESLERPPPKSSYVGVSYHKSTGKWRADTHANNKHISLGLYDNEIDAAKAYDRKMMELKGNLAKTNFPKENYIKEGAAE